MTVVPGQLDDFFDLALVGQDRQGQGLRQGGETLDEMGALVSEIVQDQGDLPGPAQELGGAPEDEEGGRHRVQAAAHLHPLAALAFDRPEYLAAAALHQAGEV